MMMMASIDRRSAPRARYTGITFVTSGARKVPSVAADLSETGMLLYLQQSAEVPPGKNVRLTFTLPRASRWLEVDAEIVRQTRIRQRTAWGLRFTDLSSSVRRSVGDFVSEVADAGATRPPPSREVSTPRPLSSRGSSFGAALAPDETTPLTQEITNVRDVPETPSHQVPGRRPPLRDLATGPQRPSAPQLSPPPIPPSARLSPAPGTKRIDPRELERLRIIGEETK